MFASARRLLPLFAAVAVASAFGSACTAPVVSSPEAASDPDAEAPVVIVDASSADRRIEDAAPNPNLPPVACGAVLPGPPMANVVEAEPGFAEALAAIDTSVVPDPLDYGNESKLGRAVVNYMLGRSSGTTVSRAEALDAGLFGHVILAAAANVDAGVDLLFLRRGLHYAYPCSRPIPGDLAEVIRRHGDYRSWPVTTIDCAKPKSGPRRLYTDSAQGVYVAETVVDGGIRETEILFTRLRDDGQFDFAAYTEAGELTNRSTFATASSHVTSSAPYTCMTCHVDMDAGTLSRLFPSGTGAGCK